MSEGPSQTRPRGADTFGTPAAASAVPAPPARAPAEGGASSKPAVEEPPEKAYVAPQVLPKAAVPAESAPEAKVVLNLPAEPVAAISEAEVRAARARRRTATVKIERAQVNENLKVADLARPRSERPPPPPAARPLPPPTAAPVARAKPLPDGDEVTPLARGVRPSDGGSPSEARSAPGARPLGRSEAAAAVATSREIDVDVEAAGLPPQKSRSGLLVGVAAIAVVAVGGYLVVQNMLPDSGSTSPASASINEAAAPTPSATAAVEVTPAPLPTNASAPTVTVASPAAATPPRTAPKPAAARPPTPPRTAAPPPPRPPVVKPTKSGDIPSEI